MSKFSIGDRVRILTDIYRPDIPKGTVGTVVDVRDATWPYRVFVDSFQHSWAFDDDDLEHFDTALHRVEELAAQTALADNNPKTRIGVAKEQVQVNKYYVNLYDDEMEEVYASCAFIEYGGVLVFYNRMSPTNYMKDTIVAAYAAGEWRTFHQAVHEETEGD